MELTQEQKQSVALWTKEGMGLSDIQKRILAEFGISMTYMDVRVLVIDLGAQVRDKPAARVTPAAPAGGATPPAGLPEEDDESDAGDQGGAGVSVTVDVVTKPGAIVSGTVVFSDGVKAAWFLDQQGRVGLDAGQPGYKPNAQDLGEFQQELRAALQRRGF